MKDSNDAQLATLAMMWPLMAVLLATLAGLTAKKFGLTPSPLVLLLPSAVVAFYTVRKFVYLTLSEDEA